LKGAHHFKVTSLTFFPLLLFAFSSFESFYNFSIGRRLYFTIGNLNRGKVRGPTISIGACQF
jgi:hypothetical protein